MPVFRESPYAAFNFRVSLGDADDSTVDAAFSEVTGLDQSVDLIQYRAGNSNRTAPQVLAGLARAVTVTLTRGVMGSETLQQWINTSLSGVAEKRMVTIRLLSEDREPVQLWRLRNAIPIALNGPTLNSMKSAIAVEQLVLLAESLDVE